MRRESFWKSESWWSVGLIVLICTLSFGLQISRLGFYWDDYASIYVYLSRGSAVFEDWSAGQARPITGLLSRWMWDTVGLDAFGWHRLHFVLYVISVLLFWRILRTLWSEYRAQTTLTALLFAVYPSYHLRPIPISFELIISLVVFLFSFWLSLIAARQRSLALSLIAALLIPIYQTIYEQNIAFEALRPLAMLYVMNADWRRWREWMAGLLRLWFLYPLLTLMVLLYRFVLFEPNETYADYNVPIYLDSLSGWLLMFKRSVTAPVEMLFLDWIQIPRRLFITDGMDTDIPGLLAVVALVACLLYLWRASDDRYLHRKSVILGVSGIGFMMIGLLLFSIHMVGRTLSDGFDSRWALSPGLVAALILGLVIPALIGTWNRQLVHLALVIPVILGVAVQVTVNQVYIDDWELRQDLFWQMRWRAPEVAPGTMYTLVTEPGAFAFGRVLPDYELTGYAGLYYAHEDSPYPVIVGGGESNIRGIFTQNLPRSGVWSETFTGTTIIFMDWQFNLDKLLVFAYDGSCLRTANPIFARQTISDSAAFNNLAPYHHPEQILNIPLEESQTSPYQYVIEPEPEHGWCFYYQQIQWALQFGDDVEATRLADEARQHGLAPSDVVEWLPFIEAYNRMAAYTSAESLVVQIAMGDFAAQAVLCEHLTAGIITPEIQQEIKLLPRCKHELHEAEKGATPE